MLIAEVCDIHARGGEQGRVVADAFRTAMEQMASEGVEICLLGGDVFEFSSVYDPQNRGTSVGTILRGVCDPIRRAPFRVVGIPGNHDLPGGEQQHALYPLTALHNFTLLDSIVPFRFTNAAGTEEITILAMPWVTPTRAFGRRVSAEAWEVYRKSVIDRLCMLNAEYQGNHGRTILLGHCEVEGSRNRYMEIPSSDNWCFTEDQIRSIGADYYCLGHFHLHQLGLYVGALVQNRYDEQDNPTGWVLLDTETGETRRFESNAPRFYRIPMKPGMAAPTPWPKDGDHVEVLWDDPTGGGPPRLPSAWTVTTVKHAPARPSRAGSLVESGATDQNLLESYLERNATLTRQELQCSASDARLALAAVKTEAGDAAQPPRYHGIRRLNALHLDGVGPFRDQALTLKDGITAVEGRVGAGKTFILEAPWAALYGKLPFRPGSMKQYVAANASVMAEFDTAENTYRASRTITPKPLAILELRNAEGSPETVAGGEQHAKHYAETIEDLLGPLDRQLSSIYQSQSRTGDLLAAAPSERKAFFAELLGLQRFAALAAAAKKVAGDTLESIRDAHNRSTYFLQELGFPKESCGIPIASTVWVKPEALGLGPLEEAEMHAREARDAAAGDVVVKHTEVLEAERNYMLRQAQREALVAAQQEQQRLAAEVARLEERHRLANDAVSRADLDVKTYQAASSSMSKVKELQDLLETMQQEQQAARDGVFQFRQRLAAWENERRELIQRQGEAKKQAELLKCIGCAAAPLECPLIVEAKQAAVYLENGPAEAEEQWKRMPQGPIVDDSLSIKISALRSELDAHQPALQNVARLHDCRERLQKAMEERGAVGAQLIAARDRLHLATEALRILELEHLQELRCQEESLRNLRAEETQLTQRTQEAEHVLRAASAALGRARGARSEYLALQQRAQSLLPLYRGALYLQEAFGSNGIPQLIIDHGFQRFNQLLQDVAEGTGYALEARTQKEKADGGLSEAILVLVTTPQGRTLEFLALSGGQREMARALFRIALALWMNERSASPHRILIADEAFDALDQDASAQLLTILRRYVGADRPFLQIILASHHDFLLQSADHHVRVSTRGGEAVIECD